MCEPPWNVTFMDVLCSLHRSVTLVPIIVLGRADSRDEAMGLALRGEDILL